MIGSFLLLGENLTLFNVTGMVLVFGGLFAVVLASRKKVPAAEVLQPEPGE